MSGLVLTIRKFNDNKGRVRFDWNLRSNGQIVSGSRQGYSRRIDCARGAEVGAGLFDLVNSGLTFAWRPYYTEAGDPVDVAVRIIDEGGRNHLGSDDPHNVGAAGCAVRGL